MSKDVMMSLDSLVPYWRNPRRITDEAVNALVESIRQYGYQQPICVDVSNTIVLGHTRYAALRRMGYTDVTVRVLDDLTPHQIKQLRVIDNRTSELSMWDFDALVAEMKDLDEDLMVRFFPEVAAHAFDIRAEVESTSAAADVVESWTPPEQVDPSVEFVCPSCFHMWEQSVSRDEVLGGRLHTVTTQEASA